MKAAETSWLTVFESYDNKVEVNQGGEQERLAAFAAFALFSFHLLPV